MRVSVSTYISMRNDEGWEKEGGTAETKWIITTLACCFTLSNRVAYEFL